MRCAYRVAEIREAEELALAAQPGDGESSPLMRRAAFALSRSVLRILERAVGSHVVLLVGPGSNGGDALWAGVELRRRGVAVSAIQCMQGIHPAVGHFIRAGGRIVPLGSEEAARLAEGCDVLVDGVLGIGGRVGVPDEVRALAEAAPMVVAVDLPSGVDADSGAAEGAIRADLTVTFGALKPGLLVGAGRQACGTLEMVDIGLEFGTEPALLVPEPDDAARWFTAPPEDAHKYSRGVVGLLAGSAQYPGAAILAVGGARASGAGMVRAMAADGCDTGVVAAFSDVVAGLDPEDPRLDALVVGPGVGDLSGRRALVQALMESPRPLVIDADGLSLDGWQERSGPTCITPHEGELRRLMGRLSISVPIGLDADDRVGLAATVAERLGCVVVLKGPGTIVATPDGIPFVDALGTSDLATPGTGDILAGLIGGLFAVHRPRDPSTAAELAAAAVTCHSMAGRLAGSTGRPVRATDVLEALPDVIADLRLG